MPSDFLNQCLADVVQRHTKARGQPPIITLFIPNDNFKSWKPGHPTRIAMLTTALTALAGLFDESLTPVTEVLAAGTVILWFIEAVTFNATERDE